MGTSGTKSKLSPPPKKGFFIIKKNTYKVFIKYSVINYLLFEINKFAVIPFVSVNLATNYITDCINMAIFVISGSNSIQNNGLLFEFQKFLF